MKTEGIEFNFKQELKNSAKQHGIILNDNILIKLELYKNMIIEWNEKINLTAIVDEKQIIEKHFIDCLEVVKYIKENSSLIDVGTGAGFPGLVIAIYFENRAKITLLDSLEKRLKFINLVAEKLGLKNIKIIHGRTEDEARKEENREKYDYVTARAVAQLNMLLEYTVPYIKTSGKALLMKGDNVLKEIEDSKRALATLNSRIVGVHEYKLISEDEKYTRNIVEVEKIKFTDKIYPRLPIKIKNNPL